MRAAVPYVAPMFSFLLVKETANRLPPQFALTCLILQVVLPMGLLAYFKWRGAFPELRIRLTAMSMLDFGIGIALAAVWIGPYVLFPSLRPSIEGGGFNPAMSGAAWVPMVLAIRMIGYAMVTPVMEELFMRSFLIRYVEVFDSDRDFREIAIGTFGRLSFLAVVAVFLLTHQMWEWWVMLPWAVLTTLWFYFRKDLFAVVLVHAGTNGAILLSAMLLGHQFSDPEAGALSLWFLV